MVAHTERVGDDLRYDNISSHPLDAALLEDDGNLDEMFRGPWVVPLLARASRSPVRRNIKARLERERMAGY